MEIRMKYLLILVVFMLPVFILYERKKPRSREVVLLAILITFTVVANQICAVTIPLHAGTTMVILSGIAFGPQTGFIVGACSRFVCNLFIGQGPWTVWQMFAWSLLGFLSGVSFQKDSVELKSIFQPENKVSVLQKGQQIFAPVAGTFFGWIIGYIEYLFLASERENFFGYRIYLYGILGLFVGVLLVRRQLPTNAITVTSFTFFMTLLVYGGIMNFASMVMEYAVDKEANAISVASLKVLYITGLPYDFSHGALAAACAYILGEPFLRKMKRIKIKYGIGV